MTISSKMLGFTKLISTKEIVIYLVEGIMIVAVFAYFFYKSFIWFLILTPMVFLFLNYKAKESVRSKRWILLMQFKEMIISINSSLQVGYSIENAFRVAMNEMNDMYGPKSQIVIELIQVIGGLDNNIPLENLLNGMARRNQIEEIENFAGLMATYKQTGGNVVEIIQTYVSVIEDKVSLRQEIETMISSKKYEQRIMNAVPFVILFYVNLSSRGFFDGLYHNAAGNLIMTLIMMVYIISVYWSNRIINSIF